MEIIKKSVIGDRVDSLTEFTVFSAEYISCDYKFLEGNKNGSFSGKFVKCDFYAAELGSCIITGDFYNCDFSGADLSSATFRRPRFYACEFSGTDFTHVKGAWTAEFSPTCKMESFSGAKASVDPDTGVRRLIQVEAGAADEGKIIFPKKTTQLALPAYTPPKLDNRQPTSEVKSSTYNMQSGSWEDYSEDYIGDGWQGFVKTVDRSAILVSSDEGELDGVSEAP